MQVNTGWGNIATIYPPQKVALHCVKQSVVQEQSYYATNNTSQSC